MTACLGCGKPLDPESHQKTYCSAGCNTYNGGLCFDRNKGRWVIWCRDDSLVAYARGVMAAELGRLLRADEIVHHINGDPTDDRVENLQVVTRAEHMKLHRAEMTVARARLGQVA